MEDEVVRGRCAALIQQLVCNGEGGTVCPPYKHQREQRERLLSTVVEVLHERAMLIYRLCRVKNEKIAVNQTEDAAYCVFAAVAFCQPALWDVLMKWSSALRPRSPELRFGPPVPMTVRLKDVKQFIARTSHLHLAMGAGDMFCVVKNVNSMTSSSMTCGSSKKYLREADILPEAKLEPELAMELAFAYFHMHSTNTKKLHAVVAAYEEEFGGVGLIDKTEEAIDMRTTASFGPQNNRSHIVTGDNGGRNNTNKKDGGVGAGALLDGDDDYTDISSFLFPVAPLSSFDAGRSLTSFECFAPSVNLGTLADNVDQVCFDLFYERLHQCLRDPLLYSPLACMEGATMTFDGVGNERMLTSQVGEVQQSQGRRVLRGCGELLRSPAYFMHPARARRDSLQPLPLQLVTSQQLWIRLLVAGLWLYIVGTENEETCTQHHVLHYCTSVVRSAQSDKCCPVCDSLEREKPVLRLSALSHNTDNVNDDAPLYSWEDLRKMAHSPSELDRSFCDLLLNCLSRRLVRKAYQQAKHEDVNRDHISTRTTKTLTTNSTRKGVNAPSFAFFTTLPTLRELLMEVCGCYPLSACRAALMGGKSNETVLLTILRDDHMGNKEEEKGGGGECCSDFADVVETEEVKQMLDGVLCIPRLRDVDGIIECAACLMQFHQECVCPMQRDFAGGIFLCHACRLARGSMLLTSLCSGSATSSSHGT